MANNKNEQRKLAREYFLTTDRSQAEIAKLVGVNAKTLSEWKNEEEWELQKAATNVTPRKTIAGYYVQLERLRKNIEDREHPFNVPSSSDSDIIIKISKSIKMLQKSLTLTDYINAFEELGKFSMAIDPDNGKVFMQMMNEFIQLKAKELAQS